ncbi:MAG: SAM-dependent methyltransferase [Clostridium sp. CAG:217_53_7]|nr:MAG: SAM-dependent methyltransferase [Clostridium sp. CAG:217_53_7]
MWIADNWKDYELIDCSAGEKLERWTREILIRPDPQVIWNSPRENRLWAQPGARYVRSRTGGGKWQTFKRIPAVWQVRYKDLTFNIKTMGFKHTGLFPEQAANWVWMAEKIRESGRRDVKGGKTRLISGLIPAICLKSGAQVVHVDASKGMVQWAKENAAASGVADGAVRWIVDDCIKFVQREIRRGNRYDIVILDPPSYGRGPKGEIWHLEDNLYDFVTLVQQVLSDDALAVVLNSYTTGLSASVMQYILEDVLVRQMGGSVSADEIGLPVTETGGVLPCGATAVWKGKDGNS